MDFRKTFFSTSFSVLIVFLAACSNQKPHTGVSVPHFEFASTSAEFSDCESKIRNQIENKSIRMSPVSEFSSEIVLAHETLKFTSEKKFLVTKLNGAITTFGVSHIRKAKESFSFDYSLSKADREEHAILQLSLTAGIVNQNKTTSISENFLINKSCNLKMVSASLEVLQRQSPGQYRYVAKTVYVGGDVEEDEDVFTVSPDQEPLANFFAERDISKLPRQFFQYQHKGGISKGNIFEAGYESVEEFGLKLNFKRFNGRMVLDKQIIEIQHGRDQKEKVERIQIKIGEFEQDSWFLPYNVWKALTLNSNLDRVHESVQYFLPKDYLLSNDSYVVQASKGLTYDHQSAYFRIVSYDSSKNPSFVIAENPYASVADITTDLDLESNDTIQVDMPEIQEVAKSILAQAPTNRTQQIQLLLNYLKTNYTYDHEMVQNSLIRPLTTEQAWKRKKGVCQHYAVLYTAIARAMKIPTRIVMGYSLHDKAVAHAWVESEISPGVWRALEPQAPESLTRMYTRFYFPVIRARFLEDTRFNNLSEAVKLHSMKFIIRPIPHQN